MIYFIDLEATQSPGEIISIGCVSSLGRTFYSEVLPKDLTKVTPFITELTGLTPEKLRESKNSEGVFSQLWDWIEPNPKDVFYCWGNSDFSFLRHTAHHTYDLKAKMMIGFILASMYDYTKMLEDKLHINHNNFKLLDFYQLINPEATQNHNSLEDAKMLRDVYFHFEEDITAEELAAIAAQIKREKEHGENSAIPILMCNNKNELEKEFDSKAAAVRYICKEHDLSNSKKALQKYKHKLDKAIENKKLFRDKYWRVKE